jgi:hypothetical protein
MGPSLTPSRLSHQLHIALADVSLPTHIRNYETAKTVLEGTHWLIFHTMVDDWCGLRLGFKER